ncbi:putative methyltransferase-domain-containing protein [Schizophyllum amplum]|uniref:Putative methyltransferase-domain-containing protein n=1 Tax=Schizophyllum amplum TaxID=97359 RepID=A0A550CS44_9AGAR|nr:putative methyltransferase-domain-containing protein [Auriculariopsis ampla]
MKPNFPDGMRITPSCRPSAAKRAADDEAFGWVSQAEAIERYGIAGRVWEASYIMEEFLDPSVVFDPPGMFSSDTHNSARSRTILELGSGTGLLSARMADFADPGDLILATDLPEVCSLLHKNIDAARQSRACSVVIRPLAWGETLHINALAEEYFSSPAEHRMLTHIVCSDLVYFPQLLAPLLRALLSVTAGPFIDPASPPQVVISYKVRSLVKESPFWSAFGLWFNFAPVIVKDALGRWRRVGASEDSGDTMFLFVAERKAGSLGWAIPDSDVDLLNGVGAEGTERAKGDSTFESLLLMDISD